MKTNFALNSFCLTLLNKQLTALFRSFVYSFGQHLRRNEIILLSKHPRDIKTKQVQNSHAASCNSFQVFMFVLSFLLRSKKDASSLLQTKRFLFLMHQEFIFKANVFVFLSKEIFPLTFLIQKERCLPFSKGFYLL